jgi:hypothetical protein
MLHQQPRCTDFFHDLLHIIEENMLVVNEQHRINADNLVSKLKTLVQKGQRDSTYWIQSKRRNRIPGTSQKLLTFSESRNDMKESKVVSFLKTKQKTTGEKL